MNDSIFFNRKEFKIYPRNTNYYISSDGEVFSVFSKKIIKKELRGKINKQYYTVNIYINGKQRHIPIHRMVYESWIGILEDKKQVNHYNDNQLDNNIENLYSGSQKQNIEDCIKNKHRVGNVFYLTIYDKKIDKIITFCPANKFIEYSGHPNKSGSLNKFFSKNWFKKRYDIIEFKKVNNIEEFEGVTTNPDEYKE